MEEKFVSQLQKVIGEIPRKVSEKMTKIQDTSRGINSQINKIGTELQYLFQQMNRSSLFKTNASINTRESEVWNNKLKTNVRTEVQDLVTFNHKGMGIISLSSDPDAKPYGSAYSNKINIRKMLRILSDKELHQKILMDLAVGGKKNAMPIWVEIMKIHNECKELLTLGIKHKEQILFELNNPISVEIPDLVYNEVKMIPVDIMKIKFNDEKSINVMGTDGNSQKLSIDKLEDYLTFIQFNNELYEAMDKCIDELEIESEITKTQIQSIQNKLATHFVTLEMDETYQNSSKENYYW